MFIVHWITDLLCPPSKSAKYQLAESCFTKQELDAIRNEHCMHVLSQYAQTVDDDHFLQWAGLPDAAPALQQGLCNVVRQHSGQPGSPSASITLDGIIVAKAHCEKMDQASAEDFAFDVLDVDQQGAVPKDHLQAVILGCMQLALSKAYGRDAVANLQEAAAAVAAGACQYCGPDAQALTRPGYAKYCKAAPALNALLLSLMCNIGKQPPTVAHLVQPLIHLEQPNGQPSPAATASLTAAPAGSAGSPSSDSHAPGSSTAAVTDVAGPGGSSDALAAASAAAAGGGGDGLPTCPGRVQLPDLGWGLCDPADSLLQPGWVWLLAAGLGPKLRQEWRLLFNSVKHGMSYSTFLNRLGDASPTLLLIQDKGGALFGGVAYAPWKKTGTFYGDYASSIFSLLPKAQIYPASGINPNIQWCGVGFSQLPNGVGFGGQTGHFGAWLDATLDTGMSRPAATFASPCLASSQRFQVDVVEAWLLAPPEEEQKEAASNAGSSRKGLSVLDQAKEDRQMLQLAGVGTNYSAGMREPLDED